MWRELISWSVWESARDWILAADYTTSFDHLEEVGVEVGKNHGFWPHLRGGGAIMGEWAVQVKSIWTKLVAPVGETLGSGESPTVAQRTGGK